MKYSVVTNNDEIIAFLKKNSKFFDYCFVEGTIKDVAFKTRDYLMDGFVLSSDPLAGRRERPTPYLTVILNKSTNQESKGYDIMRVEWFVDSYCSHSEFLDNIAPERKVDYRTLDTSIAKNACKFIMK